jgi:predicted nucleotidyltransferase
MLGSSLTPTLHALVAGRVEFILVGGVAAALNGAPVDTLDVDVVHSRNAVNVDKLLAVLESLDAVSRIQSERRLKPAASHLAGPGHVNLMTRYGPLDVLGTVGKNLSYDDLLPHSHEMDIGGGLKVRVLDLETIIAIKESIGGEKDRLALPILRRTLEEKRKSGQ